MERLRTSTGSTRSRVKNKDAATYSSTLLLDSVSVMFWSTCVSASSCCATFLTYATLQAHIDVTLSGRASFVSSATVRMFAQVNSLSVSVGYVVEKSSDVQQRLCSLHFIKVCSTGSATASEYRLSSRKFYTKGATEQSRFSREDQNLPVRYACS